ncbi:ATP-binding protein [uncultured Amnibacterium sp.]|uniref:ATP-binding protein n=1 Tax=uncultured Amnibacterium sp. TaxID=1631851 RepID=UPI0035CBC1BE
MTLLEFELTDDAGPRTAQWRLDRIELINWGTFDGRYRIDVARQGHLFTGASGSGKSSLLDAIATVLTPTRVLRFNAAAQEGASRGDDRSFVSYVRGAWSKEADETLDRAVSSYLRRGATWSGILLRFADGQDGVVTLARLFHLRGSSVDKADLHDLALAVAADLELDALRPFVERDIDARGVKAAWPGAVVTTNGAHKAYFARAQRLLGIEGDNALQLLHRTQSAKNLGSLDQLFRNFMLDVPVTFERADNAVEQFGELREAHRLVVEAREQVDALRALEPSITAYEEARTAEARADGLRRVLEPFEEQLRLRLTVEEEEATRATLGTTAAVARAAAAALTRAEEDLERADAAARSAGSDRIGLEQLQLERAEEARAATEIRLARFAESLSGVGVAVPQTAEEHAELQRTASSTARPEHVGHELHEDLSRWRREKATLDTDLAELGRATSNVPTRLAQTRRALADHLRVPEAALPFAGELIDVQPLHADWTGAIERVLRPLATTLLVRHDLLTAARRWVEGRSVGVRLVFEDVVLPDHAPRATRASRSLLHRITVIDGPFRDWLQVRLAREYDYECVDSPDELDGAEKAVTVAGLVKKAGGRYEKDDRSAVGDRSTWVLGSRNDDKVDAVKARLLEVESALRTAQHRLDAAMRDRDLQLNRASVLGTALQQDWASLDVPAAAAEEERRRRILHDLTHGDADLQAALTARAAAKTSVDHAREQDKQAGFAHRQATDRLAELQRDIQRLRAVSAAERLLEKDQQELERRYRRRSAQRRLTRESIGETGRHVADDLHAEGQSAARRAGDARSAFEGAARSFGSRWPGPAADLTPRIEDRGGYRSLRERIEVRGLPEHEDRFRLLLREKSHELMGHLLSDLREAPRLVTQRIDPVNSSLGRSRFDRDRHLRIRVKTQRGPEVTQFIDDLRSVVDGAWDDADLIAAEQRFAVLESLMQRLGSSESADAAWRRRVLDTREHVTFQAQEIAPDGTIAGVHDSSAGLSGGQRQKLVIFCLAAALRYQLAPDEHELPTYSTVVLDEAFDKADSAYTRMAMDVFVEFGFHMILATPQKLLQTIEPYVGGITVIANPTRQLSVTQQIDWSNGDA